MIRSVIRFHKDERIASLAQTPAGQIVVWAIGIGLLLWHEIDVLMLVAFTLVLLFPSQRRLLLAIAAVGVVLNEILGRRGFELAELSLNLQSMESLPWLRISIQVVAAIVCVYIIFFTLVRFDRFPNLIKQYPLITLHVLIWIAIFLSVVPSLGLLGFLPAGVWRLSYLFASASQGGSKGTAFKDHLFYLLPVFGGYSPPFGKGLDYLARHEAVDKAAIVLSQLAGIKTLILATMWAVVLKLMDDVIIGDAGELSKTWLDGWAAGIPRPEDIMRGGANFSVPVAWASIYVELIRSTLNIAAIGHIVVGCMRLVGFNVFRHTYKPLFAESIVEFWNRYAFYFKEVMVQFFFYPTFLRSAWAGPRLRMLLAVFAAAFVGNMYFRLFLSPELVVTLDFDALWANWGPRLVYCFLLAFGIWVSMLRQQKQRSTSGQVGQFVRLRRIAGVWTFYALIRIWNIREPELGFVERFDFTASLLGL